MIELLNGAGSVWAEYFGLALAQNTVFLGLVFLALYLLRDASANVKVAVGSVGVAKLLLPPFLPASVSLSSYETVRALPQATTSALLGRPLQAGTDAAASSSPQLELLGFVFALWIALGAIYLLLSAGATARLAWRLRGAVEIQDDVTRDVVGGRRVRVLRSERISTPLCVGVFPRKIFVPAAWERWTDECRRTVLRHELAHIDRHDGIFQGLQIVTQAIYFCHPLVWFLGRQLREYREMACDDASAGFRAASRIAYSRCLVEVAESVMRNPVRCESATALLERRQELLNRVHYQMNGRITMSKKKAIAALAALAIIAVPLSWYYSEATPAEQPVMKAAAASPGEKSGDSHVSIIEVYIKGKDKVAVNGNKTNLDSFQKHVEHAAQEAMTAQGKENTVVIALTCDDEVSMGTVFAVQERLRQMDLMNMSYTTSAGKDLTLILPPIDYKKRLSEIPKEHISTLAIEGGGVVALDGKKMKTAQLSDAIKKILAADDKHILSVNISEDATYGDFVTVLEVAKQAEAPRILINHPSG